MTCWSGVVVVAVAATGCHSGESDLVEPSRPKPELVEVDHAPVARPTERMEPYVPEATDEDSIVVALADWGVEITMPREPASRAAMTPESYHVELAWKRTIGIQKIDTPMPAVIDAFGRDANVLARGTTDSGIPWVAYTFEAYEGFRKAGRNVHRIIHVSRFVSLFAIDDQTHATCTGYIEHDIGSVDGADDIAEICLSMRAAHKP